MDDTLLNGEMRLSAYTLAVLKRAMEKGIQVILASGRAAASMRPYVNQVASPAPYIACNGGEIVSPLSHETIDSLPFAAGQARACARFAQDHGFYVQAYQGRHFYFTGDPAWAKGYADASGLEGIPVPNLSEYISFPTPKLLCIGHPEGILHLYAKGKTLWGDAVSLSISKPEFLEMTPPGATKGSALARLSALMPIDPETTMAFGDSLNDISMLTWAKYGIAMENGRAEVKQALSRTCPPNTHDGVAAYISRYVLKEDVSP